MAIKRTEFGSKLDYGNDANRFHEVLDLFVNKLRASYEADMKSLRQKMSPFRRSESTASGPATPKIHKQSCLGTPRGSVTKASLGRLPVRVPPEEAQIVASGEDSFLKFHAEAETDTQALIKIVSTPREDVPWSPREVQPLRDNHDHQNCSFLTRAVWDRKRVSATAEKSLHQLVFRKISESESSLTHTSSAGTKRGFSFRGIPVADGGLHVENMSKYVSAPTASWRVCWNVFGLLAVVYDLILIPLLLMELPDLQVFEIIGYSLHAYWNVDIIANFGVAYYDSEGDLVVEPTKIAKNYASSWLTLDLSLVGLDWALYAMDMVGNSQGGRGELQAGRTLRIIRFLRILRLMRLLKLGRLLAPILDRFSYGVTMIYFVIVKIMFGVFTVNHFMACFWFAVGASGERGWVTTSTIRDYGFFRRYIVAYHWCLTQFGVGASDVYPSTEGEIAYAILCLVIALLLFSFTVSLTTDVMVRLQRMHHERSEQFSVYRRYCRTRRISKDLFARTLRFLEYTYDQREKQTPASEIELLHLLSAPLRNEIQLEIWVPDMSAHGFFRLLCRTERSTMQVVCRDALVEMHFAQEDKVFNTGQIAKHMYFVVAGELTYRNNDLAFDEKIGQKRWLSEAAIWTEWLHLGMLSVEIECRLLALDVDRFCDCVKDHSGAFLKAAQYAERYVQELNNATHDKLTDVNSEAFDTFFLMQDIDLIPNGD